MIGRLFRVGLGSNPILDPGLDEIYIVQHWLILYMNDM